MKNQPHESHDLEWRDSSHYEYVCRHCNQADTNSGWGRLVSPCPGRELTPHEMQKIMKQNEIEERWAKIQQYYRDNPDQQDWMNSEISRIFQEEIVKEFEKAAKDEK